MSSHSNNIVHHNLTFEQESNDFSKVLRKRVYQFMKSKNMEKWGGIKLIIKLLSFLSLYLLCFGAILFSTSLFILFTLYSVLGILSVFLVLNGGHDAAHNAIFRKQSYNKLVLYVFDLLGTSYYLWINKHVQGHHKYPNIVGYDSDLQQSKIVDFTGEQNSYIVKYQKFYLPFLYIFYILRWIVYRDFKEIFSKRIGAFNNANALRKEGLHLLLAKVIFIGYIIVVPYLVTPFGILPVLIGFILFTVFSSLTTLLALLSTHIGEHAVFPSPNKEGKISHSYSYHQILTATDFAPQNRFLNFLFGGFNNHVTHHLFPEISHIHYPEINAIVIRTAQEYKMPYRSNKSLWSAVISHFKLLSKLN